MGTVRWGSDWTFESGDWWSDIPRPEFDVSYVARSDEPNGFAYFFADILSDVFFPYPLSEDLRDLWVEPWNPVPPD